MLPADAALRDSAASSGPAGMAVGARSRRQSFPEGPWTTLESRTMGERDLSKIEDFTEAVAPLWNDTYRTIGYLHEDGMYCVRCGGKRRMKISRVHWPTGLVDAGPSFDTGAALFTLGCVQCGLDHVALVHQGPLGPELAIFSKERGGLTTPNTPANVAYYLDQAHRAEQVGALSAAAGMYRSALEMLLYEQGYETGMLNTKIGAFLADENAPIWRDRIDTDYLNALKLIGNGSMHPNDGDLLITLRAVFEEVLQVVYERPEAERARKAKLQVATEAFKKTPTSAVEDAAT